MIPTFATRRKSWSSPPIDDIGYIPSEELLTWPDLDLIDVINRMAQSRYGGWRNWEMRWRNVLGLDRTTNQHVLDYGCGVGLEALQYAKRGNTVAIADIAEDNLRLARRVLNLEGYKVEASYLIGEDGPVITPIEPFDVIHCAGVLHHIPEPVPVVEAMHKLLGADGELRLMLYSDEAWRIATNTEPPERVEDSADFALYWQHWDPIGGYADWYNADRLKQRFGEWFEIALCEPLTEHGEYLGAVLIKK